ncbi:hypothetical protein VNO78_09842 [Psophocarpus tetragonolobus]|uniref:Uncharacterized protein n=1 Tax=Psophocarpus tetragonolobus TaxID=3891 RepID=A0AAN9T8Q7_PSOTE
MATGSNTGYHLEDMSYAFNWHGVSFQSGDVSSLPEMVPMGNYFGLNSNASGNSGITNNVCDPVISQPGNASGSSLLLDSVPELRQEERLAVEWSVDEQCKLEEGLVKYADEPSFMKYIKIAATLHDKTVRDVALRCTWITRKRRKPEEPIVNMVSNRKDKLVKSFSRQYLQSTTTPSMPTYSLISNHMGKNQGLLCQVGISGSMRQLLEQNAQAFSQISANLSALKFQDNINLFCQTRHNINTILDEMRKMPGIMSQMPPFPISLDEDLASSVFLNKIEVSYWQITDLISKVANSKCTSLEMWAFFNMEILAASFWMLHAI